MSKEKKPLNPEVIENTKIDSSLMDSIKKALGNNSVLDIKDTNSNDNSDNFFRAVIREFLNDNSISLKTEFLNPNETFQATKLTFLAKYGNMPYLNDFLHILETKRVSLERKSRIELIKAFEKRDEEMSSQNRMNALKTMFGMQ